MSLPFIHPKTLRKRLNKGLRKHPKWLRATTSLSKRTRTITSPRYHYKMKGHRKWNCKAYLASLKENKSSETSTSDISIIEVNMSTTLPSLVLDIRC